MIKKIDSMVGKSVTFKNRTVLGLVEKVNILAKSNKQLMARIDTGATKGSIDSHLVAKLKLGPIIKTKMVKSASGSKLRPVIEAKVRLKGKQITAEFTVADRSHLKYKILIGQNILKKGFIIDPQKK